MLLQAVDLRFAYRARAPVIDGVSIGIDRGALIGILGPNGSGKTTLLRLLSGVLRPASGRVVLDGDELISISRAVLARRLAVVPQETHLVFEYTVLEIALMGRFAHLGPFEVEGPGDVAAAMSALEATGTQHLAERGFQTLSGGEKQRVIIASALAQLKGTGLAGESQTRPPDIAYAGKTRPLLFLDEPTASLDLHYQVEMAGLVRTLHESQGVTILLSTHDLHFAAAVCTHVVLLREGRVLAHGPTSAVLTSQAISELYDVSAEALERWRQ